MQVYLCYNSCLIPVQLVLFLFPSCFHLVSILWLCSPAAFCRVHISTLSSPLSYMDPILCQFHLCYLSFMAPLSPPQIVVHGFTTHFYALFLALDFLLHPGPFLSLLDFVLLLVSCLPAFAVILLFGFQFVR